MILHHLGIACAHMDETLRQVEAMLPVISHTGIVHDPEQPADLCMVSLKDNLPLELIAGPIVNSVLKRGIALYHSCWEVDDLDDSIARLCNTAHCRLISSPKPAVLFGGRKVAFLGGPLGLVELLSAR